MSEPITPADARAEINRVLGDAAHPYWDRQHPEHRAAMERMQVLFAVKVGRFGPPIEYTTAREQDRAEGYRAGIEAAAQLASDASACLNRNGNLADTEDAAREHVATARTVGHIASALRALADKPAPDALLPGLMEARKMMTKYAAREPIMDAWDALRDKLDLEIEARKRG